ncbi:BglII/BstYI family type II restriction endonuclease [Bacillus wiedmannii]|uniref:BglII/BstYI family type II restriction endonuclease n=1 Tax=Bacillus cereus group TaxID=86661 RepID=UPI000BFB6C64|nr:BglII/BstYI family type II restriction endonuclease [Bacillus cereus]PGY11960.1 hypothetical protein COE23_18330 [Bacillus cereus]
MQMKMDKQHAEEWKQRTSGELYIADEEHFRHSDLFLENYTDVKEAIMSALNGKVTEQKFYYEFKKTKRNPYYKGRIETTPLNKGIRNRFKKSKLKFKYEVTFKEGVFFDSLQTGGFDFAHIDDQYNLVNFRNLCSGRRAVFDGKELWQKELEKRPLWHELLKKMNLDTPMGTDLYYKKQIPTILGEIQFGNWGLVYRDILKVIQIERDEDVDLFIYITAAGNLANAISDGTVNFEKSKNIFEEFKSILSMPIWLIGIDIK